MVFFITQTKNDRHSGAGGIVRVGSEVGGSNPAAVNLPLP